MSSERQGGESCGSQGGWQTGITQFYLPPTHELYCT